MYVRTVLSGIGLLVALVFLAAPLQAQENRLGLVGGVSIANFGGDDSGDSDSSLGLSGGAFLSVGVNESWAIRPGVYYVQKGAEGSEGTSEFEFNLDYIEVPVLLEFRVPTTGAMGVHLFGGPAVALEVNCDIEASDGSVSGSVECDAPELGGFIDTKTVDFGLMLGGGIDFAASESVDIVIEGSYNLGLTSIDDSGADADLKNRAFQFHAGVSFPVGG